MAIVAADIKWRLSGGAANADVNAALGGAMSSVDIVDATLQNLFDAVLASEAAAGDIEYRCFYILNGHASLTLGNARIYIPTPTTSAGTEFDIAIAAEAVNVDAATIANEGTAPASVTFSRPTTYAGGLALNGTTGLAPSARRAVWIRRTVTAGAAALATDAGILKVEGDTLP